MGLMVDTNVFIRFEKSGKPIDFSLGERFEVVYPRLVLAGRAALEKIGLAGDADLLFEARSWKTSTERWSVCCNAARNV
jgi:hypothetical protein